MALNPEYINIVLSSGRANLTKFLRGDLTWQEIAGGGDMLRSTYDTDSDGTVDKAEKIREVSSLPGEGLAGEVVMLNTDGHPYIWQ